jgi:hypothetical protein
MAGKVPITGSILVARRVFREADGWSSAKGG